MLILGAFHAKVLPPPPGQDGFQKRQLVCRLTGAYVFTVFTEVNILLHTLPGPRAGLKQIQGLSIGSLYICFQSRDS